MSLNVNKQVFEIWEKYRKSYIEDPPGEYDYKGKSLLLKKRILKLLLILFLLLMGKLNHQHTYLIKLLI